MKSSKMILYWTIAISAMLAALYVLAKEPSPGWPINLIHLLTKYKLK